MFRAIYCENDKLSKSRVEDEQVIICVSSPLYSEFIDSLIDDFISLRFNIIQRRQHRLTDDEVSDWFRFEDCNDCDSEDAAQYANGSSDFFLLSRTNAISVGERLAKLHNSHSFAKVGKNAVYVSSNLVEAFRDIRIHFPEYSKNSRAQLDGGAIENARTYAITHLIDPISMKLSQNFS